jgi:hypothetical protein
MTSPPRHEQAGWIPAPPSPDEARRLEVLRQYAVLDTLPEQELDDLTAHF